MRRLLIVVVTVAVLSALIARAERSSGADDWVRTVDGWERRAALTARPPSQPIELHPAIVATFQIGASLLVLLAFPGRAVPMGATASIGPRRPHVLRQRESRPDDAATGASVPQ